jgi:hypothetical protein
MGGRMPGNLGIPPRGRRDVDEHAKLKTQLKTKQSSQPRATPTCMRVSSHMGTNTSLMDPR